MNIRNRIEQQECGNRLVVGSVKARGGRTAVVAA